MDRIRIVCADDTDIALEGLARILGTQSDMEIVSEVKELDNVAEAVVRGAVQVLILDLKWGSSYRAGIDVISTVRRAAPWVKVLAITNYDQLALEAVKTGAHAVVSKGISKEELLNKIRDLVQESAEVKAARQQLERLCGIVPGDQRSFRAHEACVLALLRFLFEPDLTEWDCQVRNEESTQIVDIIASNYSTTPFWSTVRQRHDAQQVVFELKNVQDLTNRHIEQLALQLGRPRGRLGFLVARHPPPDRRRRAAQVAYIRDQKVILILCDRDFAEMVECKAQGQNPTETIQQLYSSFMRRL